MSKPNMSPAQPGPSAVKSAGASACQHGTPGLNGTRPRKHPSTTTSGRRKDMCGGADAYQAGSLGATRLIAVRGEVDLSTAGALFQRLKALAGPAPQLITLDLSQVTFIDCAGLHALDQMALLARQGGGIMGVSATSPAAARLFELAAWPDWSSSIENGPSGSRAVPRPGPGRAPTRTGRTEHRRARAAGGRRGSHPAKKDLPMSRLQCSTSKYGDLTVVVATGDVDLATAGELWAELSSYLLPTAVVALECAGITFMDSMGLQVLMRTRQHAAEQQGSFTLIGTNEHVDRVLGLTGLTAVVPRFADVETARAELSPGSLQ